MIMLYDTLRPPLLFDYQAAAYKDWLHLNLLDHISGSIGLINVSLHGASGDPRSRAVGTALFHVPELGWLGNLEIRGLAEASIGRANIGLERVALAIDSKSDTLMASVQDPKNALVLRATAQVDTSPLLIEQPLPLGQGWISWRVVPRLRVTGTWMIGQERRELNTASAYHDHNWGRWFWGDDFGWEWGCFLTPASNETSTIPTKSGDGNSPPIAIVFATTTDRAHRKMGQPSLTVYAGKQRRTFHGPTVRLIYSDLLAGIERRIPGALAALHQDRRELQLPKRITIHANDGIDQFTLEFSGRSAAQLIIGDPIVRGYSFIHEIPGEFHCEGRLGPLKLSGTGLGIFEYVC